MVDLGEVCGLRVTSEGFSPYQGQEDHCFCKEAKYEEVCTIIGGPGAWREHDDLGLPHRHVLFQPEFGHLSLDEFRPVSEPLPRPESVSDAQSMSESVSQPVLAMVVVRPVG